MCGRYVEILEFAKVVNEFGHIIGNNFSIRDQQHNFNTAPTSQVSVILNTRPFSIKNVRWGLIPTYEKPPFKKGLHNVRSESILKPWLQKPAYATMLNKCIVEHRCIFLMAGFYEWEDTPQPKRPWFIFDQHRPVFGVAGIYRVVCDEETGEEITSTAIITQEANSLLRQVKHDRMPLILTKDDYYNWLHTDTSTTIIKDMLRSNYPAKSMNAYPVHKLGLNNDIDNLEPAGNTLNTSEIVNVERRYELLGMGGRRKNRPTLFD